MSTWADPLSSGKTREITWYCLGTLVARPQCYPRSRISCRDGSSLNLHFSLDTPILARLRSTPWPGPFASL
jgi:hypothetical protein